MKRIIILFLLFSLPALGQVAEKPGRYDYLSVDLGGTYSWLSGYENFFWPIVYPYDSRSNPPAQYEDFTEQLVKVGLLEYANKRLTSIFNSY